MKLQAGFLVSLRELCSRMQVSVSICLHLHMTSHLCLLVLSGLALSSHLDLEDVFFSPQNQTVREGEAVFFQCVSGESSPPSNITWLRDGEVVTRGRQIQGEYGGGQQKKTSGTLHLFNVTLEDDGMYVCVTHNPSLNISKESRAAKLTVRGVPRRLQIIQGPDNITVAMGTEVSMHCAVRGFPVPMVHWFKDGCLLTNCSSSFSLQNNGQLLTFRNVTKEDEGSYHCEASNQKETVKSLPAFLLPAEMDWSFVQQPTNLTVRTGENVTMSCRPPHSRPAPEVSWFRNNRLLSPTAHVTVLPSGDLFFHRVQEYDSGSYFCRASNVHLQRFLTSRRATLTVLAPPSVKLWPQVLTVPVGARVVLECQVSGHPLPSISWMKRGPSKQTGGKIALGLRNASLYIQSARSYDEGVYVCEASNAVGQSQSTALLRVAASPVIVTFAGHVSCRTGASVVLPCRAVGIEPITYTWTRGGAETRVPIGPTQHRHTDDGALHIPSVQSSDAGEYFCTAENRVGRHQRRTTLTITAEEHPDDRGKQTRQILSASTNPGGKLPDSQSNVFMAEQQLRTTHHPHVEEQREETTCSSSNSGTTFPPFSRKSVAALKLQLRLNQPTSSPTRPLVTQMQPLILPPPPHPNFQSLHTQLPMTSHPPFTREVLGATLRYLPSGSQPRLSPTSSQTQVSNELFVQPDSRDVHTASQPPSRRPVGEPFDLLKFDSHVPTPTQNPVSQTETSYSHLITSTAASEAETHTFQTGTRQPVTKGSLSQSDHEASTLLQLTQTKRIHLQQTSHPQRSFNLSFLPKFYLELPTIHPFTQPTELLFSTIRPSHSTLEAEGVHHVNRSDQLNATTSNDLRVTQRSPSWLPVLEKHDIPVVVGVGVSLAFIFITVTFYSVVQKNEPTSRAAQRNLGVPVRHNERRAAGRTYENKAFEDDDCMAVIEQSPNTSDTRARPSGPSMVTVQMEPTFEELQEDTQQAVDDHSVTVEMYPEAIVDTKIDPSLEEEEKVCSLSQPSIQLQCAEDWTSNRGDNHSPCQDALPPPSSVPSCSPSPSPPSRREEGLRSSLTLQSGEPCSAPIHHSLSISHGNPPLLLSHHVSLGLTTVAVDVHFYPASTASMAVGTSTHISSASNSTSVTAPLFSPLLVNNQENEQTTGRFHQFK